MVASDDTVSRNAKRMKGRAAAFIKAELHSTLDNASEGRSDCSCMRFRDIVLNEADSALTKKKKHAR
jgi:hypothetical protein